MSSIEAEHDNLRSAWSGRWQTINQLIADKRPPNWPHANVYRKGFTAAAALNWFWHIVF